jgi:hypothetical protein
MIQKIVFDTAANFTTRNLTLFTGTIGYETDTGKFKFGDSSTAWTSLSYAAGAGMAVQTGDKTVATTGNTDLFVIAPFTGKLDTAYFSGVDALAANDTNYITFTVTNVTNSNAAMLAATDANTTKATGGTALSANGVRSLTLTSTSANLAVTKGDRIRIRAAATGTLANTVTFSLSELIFTKS